MFARLPRAVSMLAPIRSPGTHRDASCAGGKSSIDSISHRFARLVEQAVATPPASYRNIVGQTGAT